MARDGLSKMHQAVKRGGSIKDAMDEGRNLKQVHQPLHQQPYYPSAGRRNHPGGVARQVDDANVKMVSPAWVPGGGYAQGGEKDFNRVNGGLEARHGYRAIGGGDRPGFPGKGPHYGFKEDYHRYKVHEGASGAAVPPAQGVGAIREDGGERMVQPFVGIYGARADRIDAWAMRKPAGAEAWIPDYPKKMLAKGPKGVDGVAMGKARVGPDVVGPIVEFKERRPDVRGHAKGHEHIDIERVGVFPWNGPSPDLVAQRHAGARPLDDEDASRAIPRQLNQQRLGAVMRAWALFGNQGTRGLDGEGRVPLDRILAAMRVEPYRKGLDFFRRDDVPHVAMDDLAERTSLMLTSLLKSESKGVRSASAFTPSACGYASRNGHANGSVKLKEFLRCYERLGGLVHDDSLFVEMVEQTWGLPALCNDGRVG